MFCQIIGLDLFIMQIVRISQIFLVISASRDKSFEYDWLMSRSWRTQTTRCTVYMLEHIELAATVTRKRQADKEWTIAIWNLKINLKIKLRIYFTFTRVNVYMLYMHIMLYNDRTSDLSKYFLCIPGTTTCGTIVGWPDPT
jgi:hypothetical protein